MSAERLGVLFVCHANICRSPLAEGLFLHLARERGVADRLEVDSAGTWAGEGMAPHPRSQALAAEHGFELPSRSRPVAPEDLERFAHILVMDRRNLADMERYQKLSAFGPVVGRGARVRLLRHVTDPTLRGPDADVPDPFRGGPEHYRRVFDMLVQSCSALLDELTGPAGG